VSLLQALVLLASDGLWDTIRSDEAAYLALQTIEKTGDLSEACRRLVLEATQVRGSEDDTTLVMLQIL
jgi:serine/threonine protein phosphatase PrpC